MPQHDSLNECQTDACTLELLDGMEALKDTKQFITVLHVEADTIVANVIRMLIAVGTETNLHGGVLFRAGEFERIRD